MSNKEEFNIHNRLLTVLDFNLKKELILAEDSQKNQFEINIKQESKEEAQKLFATNPNSKREFSSYAIDEDMKKHIAVSSQIIVEGCTTVGKKEGITQLEVDRVLRVSKEPFYHNAWTKVSESPLVLQRISNIVPEENPKPKFKIK